MSERIRVAIQKSGRLHDGSVALLSRAGVSFEARGRQLVCHSSSFPAEFMLLRDDDIPEYVENGICQVGIVGENILHEHAREPALTTTKQLGFGTCRLSIAMDEATAFEGPSSLANKRIATSYPVSLKKFLETSGVEAEVVELGGSVEIAPMLGIADAICDLVSTGQTLKSHKLKEVHVLYESQAVMVQTQKPMTDAQSRIAEKLVRRVEGALKAQNSKYIMMNAPADAVEKIQSLIPGMESPTVIPLTQGKVAIHAVAPEQVFWETMENLKAAGASSILVVSIEKIVA